MAKIDYNKLKQQPVYQYKDYSQENKYTTTDVVSSWQNTLWPISGKYKGTKMKDLPLHYLKWVGMNFETNSKGFKLVVQELECRTNRT